MTGRQDDRQRILDEYMIDNPEPIFSKEVISSWNIQTDFFSKKGMNSHGDELEIPFTTDGEWNG